MVDLRVRDGMLRITSPDLGETDDIPAAERPLRTGINRAIRESIGVRLHP